LLASLGAKPVKARIVQQVFRWDETLNPKCWSNLGQNWKP
jgi:hypothetical protein